MNEKGDLISRQAVKDIILGGVSTDTDADKEYVCGLIDNLPSVENKGEWIKYSFPRCGEQHYQCTSCGYYINFGQWGELYTKEFKFCPNCGARMKGGE